ncbi:hypothetical protein [Halopiger goleimassiliensis]|uniref:hypothetical protein n=1 Tax=Halopiger goleimassiliensis TaxID=1293048 RepID=UPI000677B57B|nr:hypothetical protein [Halopiger goleimassiliensis]
MANESGRGSNGLEPTDGQSEPHPVSVAFARLREDPLLFVPFVLVGLVLSAVDWLHRRDPIHVVEWGRVETTGLDVRVEFVGYPTGVQQTVRPLESLIGLEQFHLVWGIGLYVLPMAAIAIAGTVTIARSMGQRVSVRAVGSLFAFVVAVDLFHRLLGSIDGLQTMGVWGLAPLAVYFGLLVKLFLVPGLLVDERSIRTALGESARRTAGRGLSVFGLILLLGLGGWLLSAAPLVGTVLSSALVAPVHALVIVAVLEQDGGVASRALREATD